MMTYNVTARFAVVYMYYALTATGKVDTSSWASTFSP